jgi:hypothetical protein
VTPEHQTLWPDDRIHSEFEAVWRRINNVQATLADLIRVSLEGPKPKGLTANEQHQVDGLIRRFRYDLKLLAPNDCKAMRRKLDTALRDNHFERSVPYTP